MKSLNFRRYTLGSCVAAALLAGCNGSQAPIGALASTIPQRRAIAVHAAGFTYETLYRFKNKDDGGYPNAGVIAGLDVVYGTTNVGGSSKSGTVFVATPSGKEAVLYSFKGGLDGAYPDATVTAMDGALYGTTTEGGAANDGIVFAISKGGTERVLHAFGGADGANPYAALVAVRNVLYGTTQYGGAYGDGAVFEIDSSGKERILYSFGASTTDGANPVGTMIFVNGALI
ncbi:MAG: choice-of-anchor tandem repeat GloVer-containing protein, partial [Candidatus Cybelea sp.]